MNILPLICGSALPSVARKIFSREPVLQRFNSDYGVRITDCGFLILLLLTSPAQAETAHFDLILPAASGVQIVQPGFSNEKYKRGGNLCGYYSSLYSLIHIDLQRIKKNPILKDLKIKSAELEFYVTNPINGEIAAWLMIRPWSNEADWHSSGMEVEKKKEKWFLPGAGGLGRDRAWVALPTLPAAAGSNRMNVIDDVQAWMAGRPNYGWRFGSFAAGYFGISWPGDLKGRPSIRVRYLVDDMKLFHMALVKHAGGEQRKSVEDILADIIPAYLQANLPNELLDLTAKLESGDAAKIAARLTAARRQCIEWSGANQRSDTFHRSMLEVAGGKDGPAVVKTFTQFYPHYMKQKKTAELLELVARLEVIKPLRVKTEVLRTVRRDALFLEPDSKKTLALLEKLAEHSDFGALRFATNRAMAMLFINRKSYDRAAEQLKLFLADIKDVELFEGTLIRARSLRLIGECLESAGKKEEAKAAFTNSQTAFNQYTKEKRPPAAGPRQKVVDEIAELKKMLGKL